MQSAEGPHLSLQRDVIIQPLERIQQGLTCVWDLTRAERKKIKILKLKSETGNSTVSLLETKYVHPYLVRSINSCQ